MIPALPEITGPPIAFEVNAMRRTRVSAFFGPLFLMFLVASMACVRALHAQAPAAGATVAVRLLDAVDSAKDPAGKQYRASVTKAVDAGNGVMIPLGAAAAVRLVNGNGSGWSTQLVSVTVNGQPVAITSGPASVTSAAQSAAGGALSSVNSVLGGFGRHVNTPAATTAMATGQRVVLPPGVMLSFVLGQAPAASQALPIASASPQAAPSSLQTTASVVPQPAPPSTMQVAAAGQHWWFCQYIDPIDGDKAMLGSRVYYAVFPDFDSRNAALGEVGPGAYKTAMLKYFIGYVRQNYKVAALAGNPTGQGNGTVGGRCSRAQDDASSRANGMNMRQKQWASSTPKVEAIQTDFADTPAQVAAIDATLPGTPAPAPQPPSSGNSKECAYHATCSSQVPRL